MNERRWWLFAGACSVNALVSLGFSIAGLFAASGSETSAHGIDVFAMYAAARSIPLAAVTLVLVARRDRKKLAAVALVLALVQACDAVVGLAAGDAGKTLGPLVFALVTLLSLRAVEREDPALAP